MCINSEISEENSIRFIKYENDEQTFKKKKEQTLSTEKSFGMLKHNCDWLSFAVLLHWVNADFPLRAHIITILNISGLNILSLTKLWEIVTMVEEKQWFEIKDFRNKWIHGKRFCQGSLLLILRRLKMDFERDMVITV